MDQTLMCLTNKVGEHSLRSLLGLSGQAGLDAKVAIANLLHRADGDSKPWSQLDRSRPLKRARAHLRR